MKIREFQRKIADALNGLEELIQGGCKAFAEDSLTVYNDIQRHVSQTGGVAVSVVTPEIRKGGGESTDGIAADVYFQVQCSEKPALNRLQANHLTALDAAELVALALDGDQFTFQDIRQTADPATGTVTATAGFETSVFIG